MKRRRQSYSFSSSSSSSKVLSMRMWDRKCGQVPGVLSLRDEAQAPVYIFDYTSQKLSRTRTTTRTSTIASGKLPPRTHLGFVRDAG
jgi:hypothetical protein